MEYHFNDRKGANVNISLQLARSPVTARDQMQLHLYDDDKAVVVQRAVELRATWVRSSHDPNDDYVVFRDPEGNEFCIVVN